MTAINRAKYVLQKKITIRYKSVNWSKTLKFFKFELFSETRKYEIGIVSNRKSARYGEFVT